MKHWKMIGRRVRVALLAFGIAAVPARDACAAAYQFVDLAPNNTPAAAFGAYTTPTGSQQVGYASISLGNGTTSREAAMFNGSGGGFTDLGPGIVGGGYATPLGAQQVGTNAAGTAMLWSGSAASAVSLHPSGWYSSTAGSGYYDPISGAQQIGVGKQTQGGPNQVLLWTGNASSVVNLTPSSWVTGTGGGAFDTASGGRQVGSVGVPAKSLSHAAIWSGTADSFIDLNPNGALSSYATGGSATPNGGELITGEAIFPNSGHPGVWLNSNPNDFIDLYSLVGDGETVATNGRLVLGDAGIGNFVWDSQTGTVTTLTQFMPPGFYGTAAWSIDADGNVAGQALTIPAGETNPILSHAVEWIAVPEPSTPILSVSGLVITQFLRRTRNGVFKKNPPAPPLRARRGRFSDHVRVCFKAPKSKTAD